MNIFSKLSILGSAVFGTTLMFGVSAFAQESSLQRSETTEKVEEQKTEMNVQNFAFRPSAGAIFYNGNQRFVGGVLMDVNVLSTPWAKLGPSIGALYSSLSGGDFFSGIGTSNSNYIFQIPANMKLTASPDPAKRLQLGVHGGANIIRSTAAVTSNTGVAFGASPTTLGSSGASWDVHPNIGGDLDYALSDGADVTLRPDVTFLSEFNLVTATLGLALKL